MQKVIEQTKIHFTNKIQDLKKKKVSVNEEQTL